MFVVLRLIAAVYVGAALAMAPLGFPSATRRSAPSSPAASSAAPQRPATVWQIDPARTVVAFTIRHFVNRVHGTFGDVKGTIIADPEHWQRGVVRVQIATASISTGNDRRDAHLRSRDFFAADSFPVIAFTSTRIERSGEAAKIHGNLTIRNVTRPVLLEGRLIGITKSGGRDRVGFEAWTTINRLDYGVKWNRAADWGGVVLGDEVRVELRVEAVRADSSVGTSFMDPSGSLGRPSHGGRFGRSSAGNPLCCLALPCAH